MALETILGIKITHIAAGVAGGAVRALLLGGGWAAAITSVIVGSITAGFKQFVRGEIEEMTTLLYEARDNALRRVRADAELCGADDVVGIKTYVYNLGSGIIEFMAIGTAVKKMPCAKTITDSLPPQAVIRDKDTYYNNAEKTLGVNLNESKR